MIFMIFYYYSGPAMFASTTAFWLQTALGFSFVTFAASEDFYR